MFQIKSFWLAEVGNKSFLYLMKKVREWKKLLFVAYVSHTAQHGWNFYDPVMSALNSNKSDQISKKLLGRSGKLVSVQEKAVDTDLYLNLRPFVKH